MSHHELEGNSAGPISDGKGVSQIMRLCSKAFVSASKCANLQRTIRALETVQR